MKVFLDDIRNPSLVYSGFREPWTDEGWEIARTGHRAIELINTGNVKVISFDHDLGEDTLTGYDVAKHIERLAAEGALSKMDWNVHSANPVGARNITAAMGSAERFWKESKND